MVFATPSLQGCPGACIRKWTNKKQKWNFPHSLWLVGCPFPVFRPERRASHRALSVWCTVPSFRLPSSLGLETLAEKIQESHAWLGGVFNSGFLPQSTWYHFSESSESCSNHSTWGFQLHSVGETWWRVLTSSWLDQNFSHEVWLEGGSIEDCLMGLYGPPGRFCCKLALLFSFI